MGATLNAAVGVRDFGTEAPQGRVKPVLGPAAHQALRGFRKLEPRIPDSRRWEFHSVLFAPDVRFTLGLFCRVSERRVQVLPILLHDADPLHANRHDKSVASRSSFKNHVAVH